MSTYSSNLRAELIANGAQAGTWGDTTNGNLSYVFDTAIAGYQTVSVTAASQALTYVNGPTATASANQSIYAMLRLTTSTGAAFSVYAPPNSKAYIIYNNSGYTATIYNSTIIGNTTAAGAGITIANGDKVIVWSDGTNFYDIKSNSVTGTVAIANGGTGQTTANTAFNALAPSQASASGKYLKSDGTNTSWDALDISTGDVTGTLPIANGGTNATTAATARTNLGLAIGTDVPSPTGTGASGTWSINVTGNAATATNATNVTGTVAIANGGTGGTTASAARTNLGLGTIATQDANNVAITGGTVSVSTVAASSTVSDSKGNVRTIVQNAQSGSYTLVAADAGKHVSTSAGVIIPASVFSAGEAITIYNNSAASITITSSAVTTYVAGVNTVVTSTTLVSRGLCTVLFYGSNTCVISGTL